ncbi:hypothetical protein GGR56DRAFT_303302 [Xylariaceae sp. FL0804]|nr:hypothetical protein GGR56DRAFT_303302 [Xylariaceae sp. FL0804]
MSSSEQKTRIFTSDFEVDSQGMAEQSYRRRVRLVDTARLGLTSLAFLCGLAVLGTSGDTLAVYRATHLPADFNLPLWPEHFNLRPTIALVAGGAVVVLSNALALLCSKVKTIRNRASVHSPLTLAAPFAGFVGVMVGMIFFYAVNASTTVDTVQSWSCRWGGASMDTRPYFGSLCRESRAALYLSVVLVPLELAIFAMAGYQMLLERKAGGLAPATKSSSPALS